MIESLYPSSKADKTETVAIAAAAVHEFAFDLDPNRSYEVTCYQTGSGQGGLLIELRTEAGTAIAAGDQIAWDHRGGPFRFRPAGSSGLGSNDPRQVRCAVNAIGVPFQVTLREVRPI